MEVKNIFGVTQAGYYGNKLEAVERIERKIGTNPKINGIEIVLRCAVDCPVKFDIESGETIDLQSFHTEVRAVVELYKNALRQEIQEWLEFAERGE
jgi:hypothetical protein